MNRDPAVRASAVRDTLAFLDKFEPGARAEVMARVPEASREVIENTPRSAWISVEHDHHTIDAMMEIFGRARAVQCWGDAVADLVDKPLLGAFVSGMIGLFGRDPARVIGWFPKGWPLVYRDVCTPRFFTTEAGRPALRFEQIAPEVRTYANYLHSWHGACRGFAHIAQVRGHVRWNVAPDLEYAEATFTWGESIAPGEREGRSGK